MKDIIKEKLNELYGKAFVYTDTDSILKIKHMYPRIFDFNSKAIWLENTLHFDMILDGDKHITEMWKYINYILNALNISLDNEVDKFEALWFLNTEREIHFCEYYSQNFDFIHIFKIGLIDYLIRELQRPQ